MWGATHFGAERLSPLVNGKSFKAAKFAGPERLHLPSVTVVSGPEAGKWAEFSVWRFWRPRYLTSRNGDHNEFVDEWTVLFGPTNPPNSGRYESVGVG